MNFNSPKDALLHYGKIEKISRGRISQTNHEFLAERVKAGDRISGYTPEVIKSDSTSAIKKARPGTIRNSAPKAVGKEIADLPDECRPERYWEAFCDTQVVGMRTCCNLCKNSLCYCFCPVPKVYVDNKEVAISFRQRKTPVERWY